MCKRPASGPSPAKKAKKAKTAYELWKKEQPSGRESNLVTGTLTSWGSFARGCHARLW